MNELDLGFSTDLHIYKTCKSYRGIYPACYLDLPYTLNYFYIPSKDNKDQRCKNSRCLPCCHIWEPLIDRTIKWLKLSIDSHPEIIQIHKKLLIERFSRNLFQHFQDPYLVAIAAGEITDKMIKSWGREAEGLVHEFVNKISREPMFFENMFEEAKPEKILYHLLYVFVWVYRSDGSIDLSGGCPFGITNDIERRRGELKPKHLGVKLKLCAIWDVGHEHASNIESSLKRWIKDNDQIILESLDMDINIAIPFMEKHISQFRTPVTRGKGDEK